MFNEILKKERKQLGLTQEQLAKKIATTRQNITNWETGYNVPSVELLNKLADFFECSVDYLLGKTDFRNIFTETHKSYSNIKKEFEYKINRSPEFYQKDKYQETGEFFLYSTKYQKFTSNNLNDFLGFLETMNISITYSMKEFENKLRELGLLNEDNKNANMQLDVILKFLENNKETLKLLIDAELKEDNKKNN